MILVEVLKLYLQPGKIFLNESGKAYQDTSVHDDQGKLYDLPDLSILLALGSRTSKGWPQRAAKILCSENTFVMPGKVNDEFFTRWDRADLRLLPHVELQANYSDFSHCWQEVQPDDSSSSSSISPSDAPPRFRFLKTPVMKYKGQKHDPRLYLLSTWRYMEFMLEDLYRGRIVGEFADDKHRLMEEMRRERPLAMVPGCEQPPTRWWVSRGCHRFQDQTLAFTEQSKRNLISCIAAYQCGNQSEIMARMKAFESERKKGRKGEWEPRALSV